MDKVIEGAAPTLPTDRQPELRAGTLARTQVSGLGVALLLAAIFLFALYFRSVGRNWDEGQNLHPDERFMTMVTTGVQPVKSLGEYFDTARSSLNPYNKGYGSFVYGTLPLFIVRYTAEFNKDNALLQSYLGVKGPLTGYGEVTQLGRLLSALFDMAALVLLFFIARKLYDTRVALLAVALGSFSVLNIQQSHYWTADTFGNFFAILTFFFCARVMQNGRWTSFLGLGIAFGAAIGTRINLLTLLGLMTVAVVVRLLDVWRQSRAADPAPDGEGAGGEGAAAASDWSGSVWLGVVLMTLAAIITFRVLMPYAFLAPSDNPLSWWRLNPQWQADMANAQRMNRGDVDVPFGHQWTDRAPLWFPFYNMVWFGMGLPLGIAAWLGWVIALWQLLAALWQGVKARGGLASLVSPILDNPLLRAHILPVTWIAITFFFHGTQWVKSVRYFLQMYPLMALMAAWLIVAAWDAAKGGAWRRTGDAEVWTIGRVLAVLLGLVVVGGAFLYAYAFTEIYRQPVTRVAASRWIYENVPTGATVTLSTPSGERQAQVPLPNRFQWTTDGAQNVTSFKAPESGTVSGIRFNFLADPRRDGEPETLQVILAADPGGQQTLARGQAAANLEQGAGPKGRAVEVALEGGGATLEPGRDYFLITRATRGAPIQTFNATLANEHWDDPIPLRLDGRDGFGIYQGLDMTNYDEDNPAKLEKLVQTMDQTDYIFMTSGRLYESIPRLPMRWPMTTRYYELMLNNPAALGYKQVAEFTSYPRLGPFVWNTDTSEEQFRVYDHPKVLIFEKQPEFNREQVKRTLSEGIAWDQVQMLWDKEATAVYNNQRVRRVPVIGPLLADRLFPPPDKTRPAAAAPGSPASATATTLMLPRSDWLAQQTGGTWSDLFNLNSLVNTNDALAVVVWYLALQLMALAAFPLAFAVFRFLGDRGWFSSKILGLLLVSYGAWLTASVQRVVSFGPLMIWASLGALALISLVFAWRQWDELRAFVGRRRLDLLLGEGVFLALFVGFLLVRMSNPDLWHPFMGGEKPMDLAYLNAIVRAQFFPSYDPWFAGGYLNYYYYGFVLVAALILMTGIVPATAYNLAVPLFFALTGIGAFAVAYNLVDRRRQRQSEGDEGHDALTPVVFGTLAAIFTVVVGNLGEVRLFVNGLSELSGPGVRSNIPGLTPLVSTFNGLMRVVSGEAKLSFRQEWWYWNASRAIPHPQTETVPITEFPYFTFLYGDLHAHMLTLPLTLLALALALNALLRQRGSWALGSSGAGWPTALFSWLIFGLTVGVLRPANTWDYPTYLAVAAGAFVVNAYHLHGLSLRALVEAGWRSALLLALSVVLWLPFISNFATAFSSVELWQGSRTVWWSYLIVHGFFLFSVVSFLIVQARDWLASETEAGRGNSAQRMILQWLAILAIASGVLLMTGQDAWAFGLPIVAVTTLLLFWRKPGAEASFLFLIIAAAVSLTLMVDVVVLKGDISRMNTVFKFYLQVWVMLAVAAAAGLAWVWDALKTARPAVSGAWQTAFALLLFGVMLYPVFATWGRANDRFDRTVGMTIDGMAFMEKAVYSDAGENRGQPSNYPLRYDQDAIMWLKQNVEGTPVILEAHAPEYRWGSRVSIYTGFPTVVGWSNHQRQQRSALTQPVVDERGGHVKEMFNSTDINRARQLMQRYDVAYVYIGPTEKAYYQPAGLQKFERMAQQGLLERVYANPEVTIYRVVGGSPG